MRPRITFWPGNSFLHRLHPAVKIIWMIFGTVMVFIQRNPWWVMVILVMTILAFPLCSLPLSRVRGIRLFVTTALFLGLLQFIFVRQGEVLYQWGKWRLTTGGLEAGIYVAGRFLSVVLMSYLFVMTTNPNDLAYALMQIGVPARYGFILITALRLVPIFEQEASIVYQAQLARGMRYDRRSLGRVLDLARQFTLPLLVSALSKVDALSVSMEGRCFGKYPRRTFLRRVRPTWRDALAIGLLILVGSVTISVAVR
jgi:energy-coupling factor transport system permease protein